MDFTASSNGSLVQAHAQALYEFEIPQTWSLSIGGTEDADFDLYIRRGERPTRIDYDYRAYSASADEKITFAAVPGEKHYVMVDSFSGSGDYKIKLEPSASWFVYRDSGIKEVGFWGWIAAQSSPNLSNSVEAVLETEEISYMGRGVILLTDSSGGNQLEFRKNVQTRGD